jgi:hypothetical protein
MNKYKIIADSHAAPGFLALSGRSELAEGFADSAAGALYAYFEGEGMPLPGAIVSTDEGRSAYVASALMTYLAAPAP